MAAIRRTTISEGVEAVNPKLRAYLPRLLVLTVLGLFAGTGATEAASCST